ncbi:MAG: cytidylate kinase [Ignavibacterium sp.]|jgi:cytidylate kinase|nr:(d)CMP kinase [Ignavibacteria bacterium]MDH7527321.1 (d)CMP kinase [Ignavibacteria bacterium]GIV45348.1 MAG: cytidylate kinase [Ignavibacterium sp.]
MITKKGIIIAIDGPAGAGKSTTAKLLAEKLNYKYIDTGAMYRAVTLYALRNSIKPDEVDKLVELVKGMNFRFENNGSVLFVNSENVSDAIRAPEVSNKVSEFSKIGKVRELLVQKQREIGAEGGIVMEGRDITTTVFPNAELKIFLTADLDIRAYRRLIELKNKGLDIDLDDVRGNLATRDKIDSSREVNPLMITEDSIVIDTTKLTIDEQVEAIYNKAMEIIKSFNLENQSHRN